MFSTTASMPPFYWKEPVPTKDHMRDNFQHIRKLAQSKRSKTDVLKPAFIPGVTKNPKYEHVQSRVAEFLKAGGEGRPLACKTQSTQSSTSSSAQSRGQPVKATFTPARSSRSSEKPRPEATDEASTKPIWGASVAANARRIRISKSTTDLTQKQKPAVSAPARNHSLRRRQPLQVQDESVYNWRFSENSFPQSTQSQEESRIPRNSFVHKVEYLPCDGICAEESFPSKEEDSARSSTSSARTSRGVNTEETRIFQDPSLRRPLLKPVLKDNSSAPPIARNEDFHHAPPPLHSGREDSGIETDFSHLTTDDNNPRRNLAASTSTKNASSQSSNTNVHRLGVVPGYLKQRKQQWKAEAEAQQEAARNSDIPPGHLLMSDSERVETLKTVKSNYDNLITEFNRLPVGSDTVRIRERKMEIEKELVKFEQAMKIFSRPRVFVKMDQ